MSIIQNAPRDDVRHLMRLLVDLSGLSQQALADRVGISSNTLSAYCNGTRRPSLATIVRIAQEASVPLDVLEVFFLPGFASRRLRAPDEEGEEIAAVFRQLDVRLHALMRPLVGVLATVTEERRETDQGWGPPERVRAEALGLWSGLARCDEEEREALVERWPEFHHPGLAELLCHLSEEAASDDADRALKLAKLAYCVAERVSGDPLKKLALLAYTVIFIANALRVAGDIPEARRKFNEGLELSKAGGQASTFLLTWRLLDREASLLRDERKFTAALDRLEQALKAAPPESKARILLNKSAILEQMGNAADALDVLRQAKPLIPPTQPRLYLNHRFNLATVLCLKGRFARAEAMLPVIHRLSRELGLDLTNVRVKWLTGRVHAGRNRLDEAVALLEEVRQELETHGSAWDTSLVTLELATVYLRQGHHAAVRDIAGQLVRVFEAQGIHREAVAALRLFQEAAEHDAATIHLTQEILQYLRRAQSDSTLKLTALS